MGIECFQCERPGHSRGAARCDTPLVGLSVMLNTKPAKEIRSWLVSVASTVSIVLTERIAWFFDSVRRASSGSPHPNIEIFGKSLFICLPTFPSLLSVTTSGNPLETRYLGGGLPVRPHRYLGGGPTSTTSSFNSGSCV